MLREHLVQLDNMVKKERRVIQEELELKVNTHFIISLFASYTMPRQ